MYLYNIKFPPNGLSTPMSDFVPGFATSTSSATFESAMAFSENIKKTEEGYDISYPVPGYDKEDFSISFEKNNLIIMAKFEKEDQWKKNFYKKIKIYENIDIQSAIAKLEKGILSIHIPLEKAYQKQVQIIKII